MKKILNAIIFILSAALLFSCTEPSLEETPAAGSQEYKLSGVIEEIQNKYIIITVTGTENAHGTYRVNVSDKTAICLKDGSIAGKNALNVADRIEVTYNGQVTRSLPPQITALKIAVI